MSVDTIAVLGLGIIGSRVASHLEKAGQVKTWNRTPKGLPNEAGSVEEAIADADFVERAVVDHVHSGRGEGVAHGLLPG